jgi:hypothetical protein
LSTNKNTQFYLYSNRLHNTAQEIRALCYHCRIIDWRQADFVLQWRRDRDSLWYNSRFLSSCIFDVHLATIAQFCRVQAALQHVLCIYAGLTKLRVSLNLLQALCTKDFGQFVLFVKVLEWKSNESKS